MPLYPLADLKDKIKKYFTFSKEEIKDLIISILIIAFIVSFKEWGTTEFNLLTGLRNLFNAILIATLVVLVHITAQRILGLHFGLRVEYKLWWFGLVIGLILIFISRGNIWFLAPGGIIFHHLAVHRLGFFRYGVNQLTMSSVAMTGSLANIALAIIFKILFIIFPHNILIGKAIFVNLWFAVFNMLPIPPLDGNKTFFYSRAVYFFVIGFILGAALLLSTKISLIAAILGALVFGVLLWLYAMKVFEGAF